LYSPHDTPFVVPCVYRRRSAWNLKRC
jgi:hypothetical protein